MPAAVWSDTEFPIMVRALVLARAPQAEQEQPGRLVVAGPPATAVANLAALRGEAGGLLAVVDAATGQSVSQVPIESIPVFDGMCVARGHVLMSLTSGRIAAFK